ncbi:DUF2141 domain-containing protein [Maribacter sp. CXY002]|uniref:DUF2141 domain-containing protein n=1 Tax=Maribacter luteocoastalis TaxID=3407671 RepID=UPI003B67978E
MDYRKLYLSLLLVMISFFLHAQHMLSVKVNGVESNTGKICFAIYNNKSSFLKLKEAYISGMEKAVKGSTDFEIRDLPKGEYAIAIFHDINDNSKLDTNMLGVPKETVAFSKGKMKLFGPPDYQDCSFAIDSDSKIEITLN